MKLEDFDGARLALSYLENLVATPGGRAVFSSWAFDHDARVWRKWAQIRGRSPDDPLLAQDALLALQDAVIEGTRVVIDKHGATFEATQIVDGGGGQVV